MNEPRPHRGPLSTIAGWMVLIAVIGVVLGLLVLSPYSFILVLLVALEALAVVRFRIIRRRKPMPGWLLAGWLFLFLVAIPWVSVVAGVVALVAYCSVNPDAFKPG